MATTYSSEVSVGTYNRIRIKCDYSGTSATLTIQFRRTSTYTGTWGDTQATLVFNGQSKAAAYNYSGTVGSDWVDLRASISGYTIPSSGGTFSWTFNNPGGSSVLGCSGTLTIPSQAVAPSNGYIGTLTSFWDEGRDEIVVQASQVTVNDGGAALTSFFLFADTVAYASGDSTRTAHRIIGGNGATNVRISTGTHYVTANTTPVWMLGNQRIYTGLYAANSAGGYGYYTAAGAPSVVTVPPPPSFTVGSTTTTTSQTVTIYLRSTGGVYSQDIQYRLNGGAWTTIQTVTGTDSIYVTKTISGLTPGTFYTMETRAVNTSGATPGNTLLFSTLQTTNFYGSASSVATHINKFYGRRGSNWFNYDQSKLGSSNSTYTLLGNDTIRVAASSSASGGYKWWGIPLKGSGDVLPGSQVTLSFDMRTSGSQTSDIRILWANSTDTGYISGSAPGPDNFQTTNGEYVHVVKKFTVPSSKPSGAGNLALFFYACISSAGDVYTDYKNVMFETGNTEHYYEKWSGIPGSTGATPICKLYGSVNGVAKPIFIRHVHE